MGLANRNLFPEFHELWSGGSVINLPCCDMHQSFMWYTRSFWATVCETVRPMLSDRCLSVCLSVCNVGVLWPNCLTDQDETWKLGVQVGLGPGHIVLDGDPAPPPKGAHPPIFGPYPLRPNGCIDQDSTWCGGRPRPGSTLC